MMYSELARISSSGRLHLRKRPRPVAFSSLSRVVGPPPPEEPRPPSRVRGRGRVVPWSHPQSRSPLAPPSLRRRPIPELLPSHRGASRRYQSTSASSCSAPGGSGSFAPHPHAFFSSVSLSTSVRDDDDEVDYDDGALYARSLRRPSSSSSSSSSSQSASRRFGGGLFWQRTSTSSSSSHDADADAGVSSLELELGEASIWDAPGSASSVGYDDRVGDEEDDDDDYGAEELDDSDRWAPGKASPEIATGESRQEPSHRDAPRSTPTHHPRPGRRDRKRRSAVELLAQFDAQRPPATDDPIDLQLWLECEAQQEAVLRYQKLIDQARDRRDYGSISLVQRQILRWYPALKAEVAHRQRDYVLKRTTAKHYKSAKRYGPYLCALPAEKMAVICAHEAILHCLLKSGLHGKEGVSFVGLACRLGAAVEEEVLVHGALHKRWMQASKRRQSADVGRGDAEEELRIVESLVQAKTSADDAKADEDEEDEEEEDYDDDDDDDSDEASHETDLESPSDALGRVTHQWSYASSHLKAFLDEINQRQPSAKKRRVIAYAVRRARQILEKEEEWTTEERVHLGAALFQILLEKATISYDGKEEMAFTYEKRWCHTTNKLKSYVKLNEHLYRMVVSDKLQSFHATTTRYKPMIIPPKPWQSIHSGAYLFLRSELMRYHGCNMQKEALMNADLSTVFNGLNALGRVPWRINRKVLAAAQRCWDENIPLGDIPSRTDFELPAQPIAPEQTRFQSPKDSPEYKIALDDQRSYREALHRYNRIRQKNNDLVSLRCSAMLKLDQAQKFEAFEELFFPYNMDFRGRAYPIPPHLSNVGSDLCRGMLMFAHSKQLGPRGLYWLKVHLANFAGKDKMSFDQRVAFVDDHIDVVRESARDPFSGERWWMSLEDPFQGLATCIEIIEAIDSGDPEAYECSLAVHMDGSCNGLQHYAALGRDLVGGKAVNLCAAEEPQDVYVGVMHEVIRRVAEEAEKTLEYEGDHVDSLSRGQKKALSNNRAAKLVNGLIDRGVVKRTVMTSVYGVTFIGARQQIQEKIETKLEDKGYDIDELNREVFQACGYLAQVTMDVMGDLFQGARQTMNWLTTCARLITQHGYPVAWVSPIGLPALQPYRQKKSSTLVTLLQTVTLVDESDDLPIHKQRQVSAFPPNYVHSLDSSHMLLTALEMDRRGLTFSAVHDSFWTHACDVDEMNAALRDVFVDLYEQPLLEQLKSTWELRYPDIEFPDLPERGGLDLNEIKKSKYFFQ